MGVKFAVFVRLVRAIVCNSAKSNHRVIQYTARVKNSEAADAFLLSMQSFVCEFTTSLADVQYILVVCL